MPLRGNAALPQRRIKALPFSSKKVLPFYRFTAMRQCGKTSLPLDKSISDKYITLLL